MKVDLSQKELEIIFDELSGLVDALVYEGKHEEVAKVYILKNKIKKAMEE